MGYWGGRYLCDMDEWIINTGANLSFKENQETICNF